MYIVFDDTAFDHLLCKYNKVSRINIFGQIVSMSSFIEWTGNIKEFIKYCVYMSAIATLLRADSKRCTSYLVLNKIIRKHNLISL